MLFIAIIIIIRISACIATIIMLMIVIMILRIYSDTASKVKLQERQLIMHRD